ncbi:MAG: site-specific DNA-methyltransferase, partial [Acidobacteria bacterium]|nr:site-specific DNA-methyltransferase [Acidobacteriota bacterium]
MKKTPAETKISYEAFVPSELSVLPNPQKALPAIAKDPRLTKLIESAVRQIPTRHELFLADAREMKIKPSSVHLIVTSPPYWTLKEYRDTKGQLGHIPGYSDFLRELDKV